MNSLILIQTLLYLPQAAWYDSLEDGSIEGYLNQNEINDFLIGLDEFNPFTAKLGEENTVKGNNLTVFYREASNSNGYSILVTAGHTTSQPLSVTMSLYLIGNILKSSQDTWKLINEFFDLYIIPTVNVDAYKSLESDNKIKTYLKNFNGDCETNPGVDLGRNFDFKFAVNESEEENNECSNFYQGTEGFSEVETRFIRDLIGKNKKIACWIHFDGTGNSYIIPWGFDSEDEDYGNEFFEDKYENLVSGLSKDYNIGNLKDISGEEYGGSLVDFGVSLGIFATQGLLELSVPNKSEILSVCVTHLESAKAILSQSLLPLTIEYLSSEIKSTEANSETKINVEISFNITNPSNSYLNALIQLNCSSFSSNFTLSSTDRIRSLASDGDVSEHSFTIEGYTTITKVVKFLVSGDSTDISFDISYQVLLQDYSSNPQYSLLSSSILSSSVPKSEVVDTEISRAWYRSSGHHEGVAVGLISVVIIGIFALVILFLVRKYKESDEFESNSDDVMSGYTIKEFSIDNAEGFVSENSFSNLKKPVDIQFANSSIEIKMPLQSEKPIIKVDINFKENTEKKPEIHSKVNVPEKPSIPEHSFKPPSVLNSAKPAENLKISSVPPPYPVKLSKDSPKVAQNVFPQYKPSENEKIEFKINKSSSESSNRSIEIINDSDVQEIHPPQFGKGENFGIAKNDWDKQESQPFGMPEGNLGVGQMKVEEHLTFNSNSSSSSSSESNESSKSDS